MGKIQLNGHHIGLIGHIRRDRKFDYAKFLMKRVYGEKFTNNIYEWARNLDGNVEVIVNSGFSHLFGVYLPDSICKQGCPYSTECLDNPIKLYLRMLKEKPLYFPLVLLELLVNDGDEKEIRKRGLEIGRTYRLDDILQR